MAHEKQHPPPWTLSLRIKGIDFDFDFIVKFSRIFRRCKLFRFSIKFKLHYYIFEIKFKPESSCSSKPESFKLKFLQFFRNFCRKFSRNKHIVSSSSCADLKNKLCGRRKVCIWLWILLLAAVSCFAIMLLWYCFRVTFSWKYLWIAWNYAASRSGFLPQIPEVIFNRIR